jgi:hypothetical protein
MCVKPLSNSSARRTSLDPGAWPEVKTVQIDVSVA